MTDLDIKRDVLFIGLGASPVCYYRAMLPAMALGADWIGLNGEPPKIGWATGLAKDENGIPQSAMPDLFRYKIIVIQQPHGEGWVKLIRGLQEAGVKVVFEIDDYLHGIKHLKDHDFAKNFDNQVLSSFEEAMKACDALIASTEWIRGNYSHFNKNAYLCMNGIDLGRYKLTKPKRDKVNIGWAGATGHMQTIMPWLQQVAGLMRQNPDVNFVSIGQTFADGFKPHFGDDRSISVPWAAIEQYPSAMTMFDIALAPGGHGGWWRGKSDLRWLEAGALGIPVIANPKVYPEVEDGVTGMTAISPHEMAEKLWGLVGDRGLRERIGAQARDYIAENRSMKQMGDQWADCFRSVIAGS